MREINQQGIAKEVAKYLTIGVLGGAAIGIFSSVFVERNPTNSLPGALYGGAGGFGTSLIICSLVFWDRKALTSRALPGVEELLQKAQSLPQTPALQTIERRMPMPPNSPPIHPPVTPQEEFLTSQEMAQFFPDSTLENQIEEEEGEPEDFWGKPTVYAPPMP